MKQVLIFALTAISFNAFSQKATIDNDTAYYEGKSYAVNDTITLGYGSSGNKNFAYITMGSAMAGFKGLDKGYAKAEAVIDKVYKQNRNVYIRARLLDKELDLGGLNKLFINLEAVIDNKELK